MLRYNKTHKTYKTFWLKVNIISKLQILMSALSIMSVCLTLPVSTLRVVIPAPVILALLEMALLAVIVSVVIMCSCRTMR